jgi:hypothetical protein
MWGCNVSLPYGSVGPRHSKQGRTLRRQFNNGRTPEESISLHQLAIAFELNYTCDDSTQAMPLPSIAPARKHRPTLLFQTTPHASITVIIRIRNSLRSTPQCAYKQYHTNSHPSFAECGVVYDCRGMVVATAKAVIKGIVGQAA